MNSEKTGRFISELRKSCQMTQKDLAAKLNVTDKAVSKWERGLSCPDIALLSPLSDILGVTVSELLNGEKRNVDNVSEEIPDAEKSVDNVLQYADKAVRSHTRSVQNICAVVFSSAMFTGIFICSICDLAISGRFTWSLYPVSSIIFAWLVFFPAVKFGIRGVSGTMVSLSLLIIPYLYVLDRLIPDSTLLMPIGIRLSVISIIYMWIIFGVFKALRNRKLAAAMYGAVYCSAGPA